MIPQWLDIDAAREHCRRGASVWEWASNDMGQPDLVLASAGDVPTEETVAAAALLRRELPDLRFRVVNLVDLFTPISHRDHPHGSEDRDFIELFTENKPIVFGFHGYPRVIHELVHHRPNPARFQVHGYMEEGSTATPFDMRVVNSTRSLPPLHQCSEPHRQTRRRGQCRSRTIREEADGPRRVSLRAWCRSAGGAGLALGRVLNQ